MVKKVVAALLFDWYEKTSRDILVVCCHLIDADKCSACMVGRIEVFDQLRRIGWLAASQRLSSLCLENYGLGLITECKALLVTIARTYSTSSPALAT